MTPKDMLTNPYFCPMPWSGLMYNFDGTVKNCIRSAEPIGNIKDNSIENILLGTDNVQKQHNILNRQPAKDCHVCYELERNKPGFDIISDRIFYIRELKKTPTEVYCENNFELKTIDVRWSNLCNFSCVYCNPEFSSRWADELKIYPVAPTDEQIHQFREYIYHHAPNLKHVYLAGGEPLLMRENLELLDRLDPKVNLRVNTNLSKADTQVFERICEFENVHWTVSVESLDAEYEYIRYGGRWQDFLENLNIIKPLDHKITFNMLWLLLNHDSIFDCVDYLKQIGFHNNSFVIGPLGRPEYLNIRNLPANVLKLLEHKLQDKLSEHPGYLLEDSYKNMLHYIQQPFERNLTASFEKLMQMDQRRGVNSSKIFTELYKLREEN